MDKSTLNPLSVVTRQINSLFVNKEPWQVAAMTATTVLTAVWMWEFVNQDESMQAPISIHFVEIILCDSGFQAFGHVQRNASFVSYVWYRRCREKSIMRLVKSPNRCLMLPKSEPKVWSIIQNCRTMDCRTRKSFDSSMPTWLWASTSGKRAECRALFTITQTIWRSWWQPCMRKHPIPTHYIRIFSPASIKWRRKLFACVPYSSEAMQKLLER